VPLAHLKEVLELAKEVVEAEKSVDPVEERESGEGGAYGVVQRSEELKHPHYC
jgi:hypothetical protein